VERLFYVATSTLMVFQFVWELVPLLLFLDVPLVSTLRGGCYGKLPFNFKLVRSVHAFSVTLVSALSARRLT